MFALAIQLTLSFGHLHVNTTQAVLASRVLGLAIQPRTEQLVPPEVPTQHHPATLADDFCAICALMQLGGVGDEPPALVLPDSNQQMRLVAVTEFASAAPRYPFFHARAPPDA